MRRHENAEFAVGAGAIHLAAGGRKVEETFYMVGPLPPRPWRLAATYRDASRNYIASYNAGWRNHYHWTMQAVFSTYACLRSGIADPCFVFPSSLNAGSLRLLDLAGCDESQRMFMHKNAMAGFERLWTSSASYEAQVWDPSPLILDFAAAIVTRATLPSTPTPEKIYVSRRDTDRRVMENESALEDALAELGFSVVQLRGMTIDDQVWLFRNARVVVGAHGAGLTNILYCRPGAQVHELTSASFINPCFSRMSQVLGLHHHVHVFGAAIGEQSSGARRTWRTDVAHLRVALA